MNSCRPVRPQQGEIKQADQPTWGKTGLVWHFFPPELYLTLSCFLLPVNANTLAFYSALETSQTVSCHRMFELVTCNMEMHHQ